MIIQPGYSKDTVRIQRGYSHDTARLQSGYSQDTMRVQPGYSKDTMNHHVVVVVCVVVCVCMICLLDLCHPLITYANSVDPDQDRRGKKLILKKKASRRQRSTGLHLELEKGYNNRGTVRVQWGYSQGTVRVQQYWLCVVVVMCVCVVVCVVLVCGGVCVGGVWL